jgi:hypothetical protein
MKRLCLFVLFSGITLLLSGCRHTPSPPAPPAGQPPARAGAGTNAEVPLPYRLEGKVVDVNGAPVAGAEGERYQYGGSAGLEPGGRFTANSNGLFECSLGKATTIVVVHKTGLAPAWKQWNPQHNDTLTFTLTPPSVLAGVVVDETDKPVGAAQVFVATAVAITETEEGGRSFDYLPGIPARKLFTTRTTADGGFRIEGFPTNAVADLSVSTPGKILREPRRDYVGPDNMQCRAGQADIKLIVEPAGAIEGRVVGENTSPLPDPMRLVLQSEQRARLAPIEPVPAGTNGVFRFADLAPGPYRLRAIFGTNALPDWVAAAVPVSVEVGRTTRDVRVQAIRGGLLAVTVVNSIDGKPVTQANVHASKDQYQQSVARVDTNGRAWFRLPPGEYHVSAFKDNSRSEASLATVETGRTNRVTIQLSPPPKIAGVVRDPSGAPAPGVEVIPFPAYNRPPNRVQTDAQGRYEMVWNPQRFGGQDTRYCLIVLDPARNFAVARDIEEDTTSLDLQLQPGLVIEGRVEDAQARPLTNARIQVTLWSGNMGSTFTDKPVNADSQGHFRIPALPADRHYSFSATAPGYGSGNQDLPAGDLETNRLELDPFVLQVADRQLGGQVVDADEKPVGGAWVYLNGQGQPNGNARTDNQGRFFFDHVCEGSITVSASAQSSYGNARAEAGDTNVLVRLGVNEPYRMAAPRAALKGKPLPDLTALGLSTETVPAGKPALLCLFDLEQRPSRRFLRLLNEQQAALQQKGLVILGLQSALTTDEIFKEWKQSTAVSIPVGRFAEKTDQTKWVTEIESLPWLILTDKDHRVVAEGFALEELEAKLTDLAK